MIKTRTVSLRKLGKNRATEVKFGRFLSNKKVSMKELTHYATMKARHSCADIHALGIHDTSEVNYQSHAARTSGLGTVGNGTDAGLFIHPLLVLEAKSEACLGLGAIHTWMRVKKKNKDYRKLPIEEKESYKWLESSIQAKETLKAAALLTIIADRESDIYEEWYRIPDERTHLLTRACSDRNLVNGNRLFEHTANLDSKGIFEFELRKRETKKLTKRSARKAILEIRYDEIEIKKPQKCSDKQAPKSIKLRVVDVKETLESVMGNEEPIHWCLLTTHEVNSCEDALEIVRWYRSRWHIEQLFRTLKTQGLNIESSQLETGEKLSKLAIIALRAATETMQLTLARDGKKVARPASDVFSKKEEEVLGLIQPRLEGKTIKQKNPGLIGSLSWAAWIIARLGGWKGYSSERPPGPITMINGQREFASICRGWFLAKDVCIP